MPLQNQARQEMIVMIENHAISPSNIPKALKLTGIIASPSSWHSFINILMLWLGSLALAFSLSFFVAYNWTEVGRFAQFALVELSLTLAILVYYFSKNPLLSQVCLVVASFLVGILLALFGQTYQTGADTWQLFFIWAILILPWAIIGRFSPLYILWLVLINLSIVLYYHTHTNLLWSLFFFNILAHILGEILIKYRAISLGNWYIYLLSLAHGIALSALVFLAITDHRHEGGMAIFVWIFYLLSMYYFYRHIKHELFILAGIFLSSIIIILTFLGFHMFKGFNEGVLLLFAFIVIGLSTTSTLWLRNIQKEWHNADTME